MKALHGLGNEEGDLELVVMFTGVHYRETKASASTPRQGRTSKAYFSYMDTEPGFQGPPHTSQSPAQSRAQVTILMGGKTEGT